MDIVHELGGATAVQIRERMSTSENRFPICSHTHILIYSP